MNIDDIFSIKSVCVVGASREEGKVGNVVLKNIKKNFGGRIVLVHPSADEIEGIGCYKTIESIPGTLDLGVVSLPSSKTVDAVKSLGNKGCKFCVPIAGGFGELGDKGRQMEKELVEASGKSGVRIIGPNTVGLMIPRIGLNTALTSEEKCKFPSDGPIGYISQSGALGLLTMDEFADMGVGFSFFISLGNEIDIDETDMVSALGRDDRTRSIAIYMEKIARVDEFLSECRTAARNKGIVALKGGSTESGSRATSLHTGSLMKTSFSLRGIFRQNGIIQASNEIELVDYAYALAMGKPIRGNRVAVISSAGGVGVIATDSLERAGFKVNRTSDELAARIRSEISAIGSPFNPIDMTAEATNVQYKNVIRDVAESGEFDSILTFALFQTYGVTEDILEFLKEYGEKGNVPLVIGIIGGEYSRGILRKFIGNGIAAYPSIPRAVGAIGALRERGEFLRRFEHDNST